MIEPYISVETFESGVGLMESDDILKEDSEDHLYTS